jgi:hypothetical protein
MALYSVDLPSVHPVSYLWAVPALPAVGAAVLALAGRALGRRFGRGVASAVLIAALGAAVGVLVAAAGNGLFSDGARLLVDAGGALVDGGAVTVTSTLVLDPLRAALALAVLFAAMRVALVDVARAGDERRLRAAVATGACAAGALLVVLADDAVLAVVAWEAFAWAAFVLAPRAEAGPDGHDAGVEPLVVSRAGQAAWLGALALLLWGLSGGPERVTAEVRGEVGGGIELHTQGDRPREASVRDLPVGPTVAPRDVRRQLALRDASESHPFRAALLARGVGALPLLLCLCLGFLLAAAALATASLLACARGPRAVSLGWVVATGTVAVAASLLSRFWFLFRLSVLSSAAAGAFAALAVATAAVPALRARAVPALRRAVRELAVLPSKDFARAAAWLDRLVLAPAGGVLAFAALVLVVALLVLR